MGAATDDGFQRMGRLDFIDKRLDPASATLRVRAVFDYCDGRFTPGLAARLRLVVREAALAVLGALEEAELAFRVAASAREKPAGLEAANQAAALARARFEAGVSDFLSVLDAERERLAASDRAAAARGAGASAIVGVFRALGVGVPG